MTSRCCSEPRRKAVRIVLVVVMMGGLGRAAPFPPPHDDDWIVNLMTENETIPLPSAKVFLEKFGWVEPSDWTAISPSLLAVRRLEEGAWKRQHESRDLAPASRLVERADELSDDRFEQALRSFQQANGLPVTGRVDEATSIMMRQPRCGVPDKTTEAPKRNVTVALPIVEVRIAPARPNLTQGEFPATDFHPLSGDGATASGEFPTDAAAGSSLDGAEVTEQPLGDNVTASLLEATAELPLDGDAEVAPTQSFDHSRAGRSVVENVTLTSLEIREDDGWIFADRKKEIDAEFVAEMERIKALEEMGISLAEEEGLLARMLRIKQRAESSARRRKRSNLFRLLTEWEIPPQREITWRLAADQPSANPYLARSEVWYTLNLAFRMWSEVLPRTFRESPSHEGGDETVDILIGFASGQHQDCPATFDTSPYMREYAHAWPLPWAQVHFNDDQLFVPYPWKPTPRKPTRGGRFRREQPISLLKVALHEIGHTLGLKHSNDVTSIMYPYYKPYQSNDGLPELGEVDRNMIQQIYGECDTRLDAIFDLVHLYPNEQGWHEWRYNTFAFHESWFWRYENQPRRPSYGHPHLISQYFRGVMQHPQDFNKKIDGVFQIRDTNTLGGAIYFVRGDSYMEYDAISDRVLNSRLLASDFPRLPTTVDSVLFKWDEHLLYFFKGRWVYRYWWPSRQLKDILPLHHVFQAWGGDKLPGNMDAAYYSYTDQTFYLFKGAHYWPVLDERHYRKVAYVNRVGRKRRISSKWRFLCDVGQTEIPLNVPGA